MGRWLLLEPPRVTAPWICLEVARHARAEGDTLDTYEWFKRDAMTYPSGCHGAEVVIDPDTGQIELVRYVAVDDYGELVNPMLVEGQMHGAIAQGVGQALLEASTYDAKNGPAHPPVR